jgi:hypothetical protein
VWCSSQAQLDGFRAEKRVAVHSVHTGNLKLVRSLRGKLHIPKARQLNTPASPAILTLVSVCAGTTVCESPPPALILLLFLPKLPLHAEGSHGSCTPVNWLPENLATYLHIMFGSIALSAMYSLLDGQHSGRPSWPVVLCAGISSSASLP